MRGIRAIIALDLKRFFQSRVRLITGMIQPLLYLFVLGSGLGGMMRGPAAGMAAGSAPPAAMAAYASAANTSNQGAPAVTATPPASTSSDATAPAFDAAKAAQFAFIYSNFRGFIFPGVISLTLLFATTFAAISIVFDRQIGFFKAILVSPVSRPAIALGKIVAGAIQGMVQGAILLCFLPLVGLYPGPIQILETIVAMFLAAMTFSALGVAMASRFTSTTVFPIMTSAVIMPMFFLSGAMFPLQTAPALMQKLANFDPVAYAVDLMRIAILGDNYTAFFNPITGILVMVVFITVLTWSAVSVFSRGEEVDLTGGFNWRR